jgi:CMP-N-acetylneuraminic acid synthetase
MATGITALIGVRGGSKRVANKNSRPFAGSNLLAIKVAQLRRVPGIDRVIVNSECDDLLAIARDAGAETVKRDPMFATDSVLTSEYYRHIAENCNSDVILSATVTTPLARSESYQAGIEKFLEKEDRFDSVTSCVPIKEFLYRDGTALNYDPAAQVRSQDLPDIVALNYVYSIITRADMIRLKNIVGRKPCFVSMPRLESIDIDTSEDFFIAETLYRQLHLATGKRMAA